MAKPIIGIPGYKSESGVFGVGSNYLEWVNKVGNPRIILPWEEKVECDLLLLPGGPDLNPSSYGAIPEFKTTETCVFRQYFFDKRLDNYVDNTPIFGICLGAQQLNVKLGGTLTQDLPFHPASDDRWQPGHEIEFSPYGLQILGRKLKEKEKIEVNSHHHQGITEEQLGKDLDILTFYNDAVHGPIIESTICGPKKIAFVQWHPKILWGLN